MIELLKIVSWNANGLPRHVSKGDLLAFLKSNEVDILLVSETHFNRKTHCKVFGYDLYHANHPSGTSKDGAAILVRNTIKHSEMQHITEEHIQAASIQLNDVSGKFVVSSVYFPPQYANKEEDYSRLFQALGSKFVVGGDFNAKHGDWGSRTINTKGRALRRAITRRNLKILASGEPTHWPGDPQKIPDAVDFFVAKGIDVRRSRVTATDDLASDHSPIFLSLYADVLRKVRNPSLYNRKTDWDKFRNSLERDISLSIPLKTNMEVEQAVLDFTCIVQDSAWCSTPDSHVPVVTEVLPQSIREKISERRRLQRRWRKYRSPDTKSEFNRCSKRLTELLADLRDSSIQGYLEELTPGADSDYSLWRATKRISRPVVPIPPIKSSSGAWARSPEEKAQTFAEHLAGVFRPWSENSQEQIDTSIEEFMLAPHQLCLPMKPFSYGEIKDVIKCMNPKKSPGFDLMTAKVLRELPPRGISFLRIIFNAMLRLEYVPLQLKVAQIIMCPKPGKPQEQCSSYRPISLLPILSKLFEKLMCGRLEPIVRANKLIPDHQFGFRKDHSTIEQAHRVVDCISRDMENRRYCSAVFLDVQQAFDKVWHPGLLYKLKKSFPPQIYMILKSYLENRSFFVKYDDVMSAVCSIESGVPQGSVWGPLYYLIYTADVPQTDGVVMATYADDTLLMSSDADPVIASEKLQLALCALEPWLQKWQIKISEPKSTHITFTTKQGSCPPVSLHGVEIPCQESVRYLGMHLDRRLTWQKHILTKRCQLGLKLRKMYWMLGRKSKLSLESKVLLYKAMLKPIWTYGIQLWGSASHSNIEILQRFQNKVLRILVDAPRYVPNDLIRQDLMIPTVQEEIENWVGRYKDKLVIHPNMLARKLTGARQESRFKRPKMKKF